MKCNVKILATGGTIAGSANSSTATTGYKSGAIGIDALHDAEIDKLFDTLMMTDSARSGKIFSGERV